MLRALLLGLCVVGCRAPAEPPKPEPQPVAAGPLAPDFTLPDLAGNRVALHEVCKEDPVVLIFGSYS